MTQTPKKAAIATRHMDHATKDGWYPIQPSAKCKPEEHGRLNDHVLSIEDMDGNVLEKDRAMTQTPMQKAVEAATSPAPSPSVPVHAPPGIVSVPLRLTAGLEQRSRTREASIPTRAVQKAGETAYQTPMQATARSTPPAPRSHHFTCCSRPETWSRRRLCLFHPARRRPSSRRTSSECRRAHSLVKMAMAPKIMPAIAAYLPVFTAPADSSEIDAGALKHLRHDAGDHSKDCRDGADQVGVLGQHNSPMGLGMPGAARRGSDGAKHLGKHCEHRRSARDEDRSHAFADARRRGGRLGNRLDVRRRRDHDWRRRNGLDSLARGGHEALFHDTGDDACLNPPCRCRFHHAAHILVGYEQSAGFLPVNHRWTCPRR